MKHHLIKLPVGARVMASLVLRVPTYFNTLSEPTRLDIGTVIAHLPLGGLWCASMVIRIPGITGTAGEKLHGAWTLFRSSRLLAKATTLGPTADQRRTFPAYPF